jgi:SAM-dependent methyltransferase
VSHDPQKTHDLLAKHHRDGEQFAALMRDTFHQRFNDAFWQAWEQWCGPHLTEGAAVLDLGTGPGLFLAEVTRRYPGVRALGVEFAPWMFEAMSALPPGAEVFNADLHDPNLPLPDDSVSAALASVVLHELNQPVRALREVYRCLRPGAPLFLYDWVRVPLSQYLSLQGHDAAAFDPASSPAALDDIFTHFIEHNRFSGDDLTFILQRLGFTIAARADLRDGHFVRLIAHKAAS